MRHHWHYFCGMPFVGNSQSAIFYPPTALYWLLPERYALLLDAYFHSALMAGGLYHLARALGLGRAASLLAALTMALGTDVSAHLGAGHMAGHDARAYLGWNLWVLLLLLRTGRLRYAIGSAVLLVLQFGAGYPPVALMTYELCAAMAIAWALTRAWRCRTGRAPGQTILPPRWGRAGAVLLALCIALSGVYVLPMRETSKLSVHGDGLHYRDAVMASGTWKTFARAAAPELFGGDGDWQWSMQRVPHEEAGYIGIITLLLACSAPLLAKRVNGAGYPAAVPWLGVLMVAVFLIVLGENTPVYKFLFDHLAIMRLTRIPARWMEAWSFGGALLAGFAFDGCRQRIAARSDLVAPRRLVFLLYGVAAVGLTLAIFLAVTPRQSPLWMTTAQQYIDAGDGTAPLIRAVRMQQKGVLACVLMSVLAVLGASCLTQWIIAEGALRLRRERMMVALIVLDVIGTFWGAQHSVAPDVVRDKVRWAPVFAADYRPGARWVTHFDDEREVNQGMLGGIDIFNGYDPLAGRRFFDCANYLEQARFYSPVYQPTRFSPLLTVAGVEKRIDDQAAVEQHNAELRRQGVASQLPLASAQARDVTPGPIARQVGIWRLRNLPAPWPRAYLTNDILELPDGKPQLAALERLGADPATHFAPPVVATPGSLAVPLAAGPAGTVAAEGRGLNFVRYNVNAARPAVLVELDALYPGWQAWCNGRPTSLHYANYLFRGFEVPAGHSQVTVIYNTNTYRFGLFMSLVGGTALLMLVVARRPSRR